MEMNEKVSIIIPVYNTQKYLQECIESMLNQTYVWIEIILVDDGSSDESGKVCDAYAKIDTRVKVIHQKNNGLSAARNKGIENASGKYIVFIDSDDFIAENMIEVLLKEIARTNADLAICNFKYIDENGEDLEGYKSPLKDEILDREDAIKKLFDEKNWYYVVAWNKMYKSEIWNNMRFPIGYNHEDEAVIHRILNNCERVVTTQESLIFYRQVKKSIMHSFNPNRMDKYYALADRLVFLEKQVSKENIRTLSYQFWYHYLEDFFKYYPEKANKKYIGRMKKALYAAMPIMARCGFLTKKDTISLRIFLFSPTLYKKLFIK